MKILIVSKEEKVKRYTKDHSVLTKHEIHYADGISDEEIINACPDAEILIADAIQPVSANVIAHLPNLRLIHSEGVAFNKIDVNAASEKNIFVCNNKGMNANAVAEQTLLLMLGLLRDVVNGDKSAKSGTQINTKMSYMVNGNLRELGECTIGLVGFGDIAKATALFLRPFGCKVLYTATHRHSLQEESLYNATYAGLDSLLADADIVSLHLPANENNYHLANKAFFDKMKPGAYIINTSRGELVDNEALVRALKSGHLQGAGLDTIEPEPVTKDNYLLQISEEVQSKLLLSCHIGGITAQSFARSYSTIWDNVAKLEAGETPLNVVVPR